MSSDEQFMQRCIELAKNGEATVSPNPLVGSVIVFEGKIIGEGWHRKAGEAHAEVNAIQSVSNRDLLKLAVIYVSLEPCSHFGKTPPCSDLIISSGFKKVVMGSMDPNPEVAGRGIEKLRQNGIVVITGVLEKECISLNNKFFTYHQKKRPFITLKWAQTADGFLDKKREKGELGSYPISGELSKPFVHKMRASHDAILIGSGTARIDNPTLNVREYGGESPLRLVLDRTNSLSKNLKIFTDELKTWHFTTTGVTDSDNYTVIVLKNEKFLKSVLNYCYKHQVQSILVEGGAEILKAFIATNLWDDVLIIQSNIVFKEGLKAPVLNYTPFKEEKLGNDLLKFYRNP